MNIFTVSFFGHRELDNFTATERRLEQIVHDLLMNKEYVEFLVGRNGDFDQLAASTVRRMKCTCGDCNSSLVLVLPYPTAEYRNNEDSFHEYYDDVEICDAAAGAHFKSAMQIRNREMVDRSDLVIFCVERSSGGAYQTMKYAMNQEKDIIQLCTENRESDKGGFKKSYNSNFGQAIEKMANL